MGVCAAVSAAVMVTQLCEAILAVLFYKLRANWTRSVGQICHTSARMIPVHELIANQQPRAAPVA